MSLLELKNISLKYKDKKTETVILDNFNFSVDEGEFCVVTGDGGEGKTSFLNMIAGIKKISDGEIIFDGENISKLKGKALAKFYRDKLSFVRHSDNLFDELSVRENFSLITKYSKSTLSLKNALKVVGLADKEKASVHELSNSEKQRLAVAFAISKKPKMILCDDPIAGMDSNNSQLVLKLLIQAAHEMKLAVIFATANESLVTVADKHLKVNKEIIKDTEI